MKAKCVTALSAMAKWVGRLMTCLLATISPPIADEKVVRPKCSDEIYEQRKADFQPFITVW
jgi:hypothetical protein